MIHNYEKAFIDCEVAANVCRKIEEGARFRAKPIDQMPLSIQRKVLKRAGAEKVQKDLDKAVAQVRDLILTPFDSEYDRDSAYPEVWGVIHMVCHVIDKIAEEVEVP